MRRRLDPLGLVLKAGTWYLVARHRSSIRTWRVGRIDAVTVCAATFERPHDFDLAAWWAQSSAEFDRSLLHYACTLRLSPAALRLLPHVTNHDAGLRAAANAAPPDAEGWRAVELEAETEQVAATQLTALGEGIEVIDPPSLRAALHEIARAMAANNAPAAQRGRQWTSV